MRRFWNTHIEPILMATRPARIMEIGADEGWNTGQILNYCRDNGAFADVIDPVWSHGIHHVFSQHSRDYSHFHQMKSLDAVPLLPPPDVVLLDGDHNWRTVYQEFTAFFEHAGRNNAEAPIVLFHDAAWPYARRDMYYAPDDMEEEFRHPFAYKGILPGQSDLSDEGMNCNLANALHEGGPRNGVLTAVENFVAEWPEPVDLRVLPFFNGMGIAIPQARMTPQLKRVVDSFFEADALMKACEALEANTSSILIAQEHLRRQLATRTEALERAREFLKDPVTKIKERDATIAELEADNRRLRAELVERTKQNRLTTRGKNFARRVLRRVIGSPQTKSGN